MVVCILTIIIFTAIRSSKSTPFGNRFSSINNNVQTLQKRRYPWKTGGHFVCACVNIGCWSATEAFSVNCYVQYQHWQAVFWSWLTCIGCYVSQTCSLRYRGTSTMKVSYCNLAVALERTVFSFVKHYIVDKMAAECSHHLTFRAHFLKRRKRSVW